MRRTLSLTLLLVSAPAVAGTLSEPILGGTPTTAGQYPSVVAIEVGGGLCTGTLIDKEWVLTAAHCVQNISLSSIKVHFGTINLNTSSGTTVTASMAVAKPTFNEANLGSNDIGLIKLSRAVTDVAPTPVNLIAAKAPVGISVTMVGFGATGANQTGSIGVEYVVQQTSVACSSFTGSDTDLLCFNQTSGKGKCNGDSGGPSFAMIDGRMTQVGITSFGDQSCTMFGADTRTDVERAFLLQYIPQLECSTDADCPDGRMCFYKKCIAQPFSPTGLGTACTGNADCDSGTCAMDDKNAYCSMNCTLGDPTSCPEGLECVEAGAGGACWPPEDTGCCDASGKNAGSMLFGIALFGLVLRRRRRR
ncbi:MAG TPA: serine protease [Kofleriaceae bacterium]